MAPKDKRSAEVTFCSNCGQIVAGNLAANAHATDVRYCWKCGAKLDENGKCPNEDCVFFGKDPGAPPA